jgi:hypothetical protein
MNEVKTGDGSSVRASFQVEDPLKATAELAHILLNLRRYTKLFDTHFGYTYRTNKKYWENKADRWLAEHIVPGENADTVTI